MAIFKCKMCGGDLNVAEGLTVCECEYCGTKQTVPSVDNEKKLNLFNRANRLRINGEFDKAAAIYESIVAEFPEEAEGYWGLVICNYGIEYVDDPATANKIPTCHRASFEPITSDENYKMALEYADITAQKVYRDEAREIDRIREEILAVSKNEKPYDIFICYKETDEKGDRTVDSVIAQDVYDALTAKGYRVFFSRISLEEKLGRQYEPYIFAALNSAKIMLSFGTKYEYFHAVWVKNEWSRFLKLMAKDKTKLLIPCYKDMDAYDMPDEFKALQAQDMGKVGAVQDLIRGIDKLLQKDTTAKETVVVQQTANNPTVDTLLERAFMFLEDGEWGNADDYCEKALDIDPKNAKAYLGKLLVDLKCKTKQSLGNLNNSFEEHKFYQKIIRFASNELKNELEGYVEKIKDKLLAEEQKHLEQISVFKEKRKAFDGAKNLIAAGDSHTVGLKSDGTVIAVGDNSGGKRDVSSWEKIVAVAAGFWHTVGLKADGTVIAVGDNDCGQCDVDGWRDIVAVAAGSFHTVGLKADGTVIAVGDDKYGENDVNGWEEIVAVAASAAHTVGLKKDGTVIAVGSNKCGQCDVSSWKEIVAVAAGGPHTVGLKADGTVIAVGNNDFGMCDVDGWRDIVAVAAGSFCTVGLKADGTVVAVGGGCIVNDWKEIVAVAAGNLHTLGLKADGTVVADGNNEYGECDVTYWNLFENYPNSEEERRNQGVCQHCGGTFKGLFTKKCSSCGKEKDY